MPPHDRGGGRVSPPAPMPPGTVHLSPCQQGQFYYAAWMWCRVCSPNGRVQCQFSHFMSSGSALPPVTGGRVEEGHFSLSHSTIWQMKDGPRSRSAPFRAPDRLHLCQQGQLYCAAGLGAGPTIPSAAARDGQGQLFHSRDPRTSFLCLQ